MNEDVWKKHPFVAHYTDQVGLEGILHSQSLHATHYKYLNDKSELLALREPLARAAAPTLVSAIEKVATKHLKVKNIIENEGIDAVCLKEAKTFVDTLYATTFEREEDPGVSEPYIVSFCGHNPESDANGLLSQWRAYGNGAGYAIVFDAKRLSDMFKAEAALHFYSSAYFGDVVYGERDEAFKREFANLFSEIQSAIESFFCWKPKSRSSLRTFCNWRVTM